MRFLTILLLLLTLPSFVFTAVSSSDESGKKVTKVKKAKKTKKKKTNNKQSDKSKHSKLSRDSMMSKLSKNILSRSRGETDTSKSKLKGTRSMTKKKNNVTKKPKNKSRSMMSSKSKGKGNGPGKGNGSEPTKPPGCYSTTGPCISSFEDLQTTLMGSSANDVVALCGNTTIDVPSSLAMLSPSMTLCCETDECKLQGDGKVSILRVTAKDSTISNIDFQGGVFSGGEGGGGNLGIVADGDHLIEDCTFDGGIGEFGGNVFVQTLDTLTIHRSKFTNGEASQWAGGILVYDASEVVIEDSEITDNKGLYGGGMLMHWNSDIKDLESEGQDVSISNSIFARNEGAGYVATNMGFMPKLSIQLSTFSENNGEGAANFCCPDEFRELKFSENSGYNNTGFDECNDGFFIFAGISSVGRCIALDAEVDE